MKDAFSSNFDRLRELFSIIMAFCEPSNPLQIWQRTKELMMPDFRRRHLGTVLDDELANDYILTEIQDLLTQISPSLTLESINLPVPSVFVRHDQLENTQTAKNIQVIERIVSNAKLLNNEQKKVFNIILGETLPGVTSENLRRSVQSPFNLRSACSGAYFLDAPGGTGKLL